MDTKTKFIPINRRIVVRKCTQGERKEDGFYLHGIAITEISAECTGWAEIIDLSPDCKLFTANEIGTFVNIPAYKPQYMSRIVDEDFVVKEQLFELPPNEGGAHPYVYRG